jgi:hypothetical protein
MTSNFDDFYKNKNVDNSETTEKDSAEKNEKPLTTIENPKLSKVINFEDFIKR